MTPPPRVAIYARYSTDLQNPNSVRDQIASCRTLAKARGWRVVAEYSDEAMSGIRSDRPGFRRLQDDLAEGRYDIVLIEALDRLSRSMKDTAGFYQIADFHDVRLHTVDAGEIGKMHIGITSMMSEMFLDNLRVKTHRGVKAQVEAGKSGGGRAYGYRSTADQDEGDATGALVIEPDEAEIVRRIFRDYAAGISPQKIAATLNAEGVPSPRASAGSGHWKQNTINGNRESGNGILNNEMYVGQRVWNRREYRKNPSTSKRVARLRPEAEWVRRPVPELRIVDDALWGAVKARQGEQTRKIAKAETADRQGLGARGSVRRRKYLLSGLLECAQCGGALIIAGSGDYKRYYCSNAKEKGPAVCVGMPGVSRRDIEGVVLRGLRDGLMSDMAVARFRKDYARHLAEQSKGAQVRDKRRKDEIRKHEAARANFKAAIGAGHINPTILEGLSEAEARLADLMRDAAAEIANHIQLPDDLAAVYRAYVEDLSRTLSGGDVVGRASEELHRLIDKLVVSWDPMTRAHDIDLQGDLVKLLRAGGTTKAAEHELAAFSLRLVAGIGFEPMTFRL